MLSWEAVFFLLPGLPILSVMDHARSGKRVDDEGLVFVDSCSSRPAAFFGEPRSSARDSLIYP